MTDPDTQVSETPVALDEAVTQRLKERLLDPEHATQLKWCVSQLEHRLIGQTYRNYFKGSINASYPIVRVQWNKLTAQHILSGLERLRRVDMPLLETYASIFIEVFEKQILAVLEGTEQEGLSEEAKLCLRWLVEDDLSEEAQASAITELSQALSVAREALSQEQKDHQSTRSLLDEERRLVEKLRRELEQGEERLEQRVRTAVHKQAETSQKDLTHAELLLRRERDAHQRTADQAQARVEALEHQLSRQQQEEYLDAYQQVRDLKLQLVRERADSEERRTRLHQQQQLMREKYAQLQRETTELRELASRPALDDTLLQGALVIDYERLATAPLERFLTLFSAYRDALQGHPNEALAQASNLAQLAHEPAGILVLGLERLLEDGANLPLERYLRTRIFQQESKLHHLIERLDSPRLGVSG